MSLNTDELNAIQWYVKECTRNTENCGSRTIGERVAEALRKQTPLVHEKILWRGHVAAPAHIDSHTWFSTTNTRQIAKNLFTNSKSNCCLFKIHVMPGIRVLDVAKTLTKTAPKRAASRSKRSPRSSPKTMRNRRLTSFLSEEREWIVEGGGQFYKDPQGTEQGFSKFENVYETYYFPKGTFPSPKRLTSNNLLELIPNNEYNFVNSPSYFNEPGVIPRGFRVSPKTKENAFQKIQSKIHQ